jgi:hypothetical protein
MLFVEKFEKRSRKGCKEVPAGRKGSARPGLIGSGRGRMRIKTPVGT